MEAARSLTSELESSVFRAFERSEFLDWPAWTRLQRILTSNGGSYGISGPRGSGKTWLMLRAIEDVRAPQDLFARPGLGLWYPSPSEYSPLAFLASLSDSFASEIERRYGRPSLFKPLGPSWLLLGVILLFAAGAIGLVQIGLPTWALPTAVATVGILALAVHLSRGLLSVRPEGRLLQEALLVRERARYTATQREASELGAEAGRGFVGRYKASRERELVERPATLSTLVNDFRALAEHAGAVSGRVVIAVDELDKMVDPEAVRDLLRDIKGIFEVPRVHFLVSVSDEAARKLNLGALGDRDEFSSSFYTVIELPPARPQACAELLQRRGRVAPDVALALAVIAGGNPREVLRLAELVGHATTGQDAVVRALREEAMALRRDIVTTAGGDVMTKDGSRVLIPAMGATARTESFKSLPEAVVESPASVIDFGRDALERIWDPAWADAGWDARFQEAWRRLVVRLVVAARLAESASILRDEDLELLQDVVVAASQSSAVGRIVLESRLQVESRRSAVEEPTARSRLDEIARRFDPAAATSELDGLVSDARIAALDAQLGWSEIRQLVTSTAGGERAVGLAAVQATAPPESFDVVLSLVQKGSPFDQFHALSALESLRQGLTKAQRVQTIATLQNATKQLPPGSSRLRLVERILTGIERDSMPAAAS